MDSAKQQLIDRLKSANNVLVTVSRDPSVDQLAACIGLTLLLNKQNKHAAAVFSGEVPSTLEFLQPDETLEKNTDSLRDFIISLDKSKADKLRYKVEDNIVRIFITPYKTSISQDDLEFSEGDFNVDVVVALGVRQQEDLDAAIVAHGRILHDATVASINIAPDAGLGTINWYDPQASSLSELVTELAEALGPDLIDNQIATALLTGIVSETNRFSNDKTTSVTMSVSAELMAAGANQQLVASKLEEPPAPAETAAPDENSDDTPPDGRAAANDGTLQIDHTEEPQPSEPADDMESPPAPSEPPASEEPEKPSTDTPAPPPEEPPAPAEPPAAEPPTEPPAVPPSTLSSGPKLVTEPPSLGGTLTANTAQEGLDPTTDPMSLPKEEPPQLLDRKPETHVGAAAPPSESDTTAPAAAPPNLTPPPPSWMSPSAPPAPQPTAPTPPAAPPADDGHDRTLTELEQAVNSPHVATETVDEARDEVNRALADSDSPETNEPVQSLGAQPLGGELHPPASSTPPPPPPTTPTTPAPPPATPAAPSADDAADPNPPPPVPPPIPFQFGNS